MKPRGENSWLFKPITKKTKQYKPMVIQTSGNDNKADTTNGDLIQCLFQPMIMTTKWWKQVAFETIF